MTEEEIKEILESKSFATIVMGLSPGFGASQGTEQLPEEQVWASE